MYKYSGKGLFSKKPNLRDIKKKMDEVKNRTPEEQAIAQKASDEKRKIQQEQKQEKLDENLQLASILSKKVGRTVSKGATSLGNLYKKVGIDIGMEKKLADAGQAVSDLGKVGKAFLSGKIKGKGKGGFLPQEKQFFKVAREEYKPDPPTQIDEFELVYKSPTIHVYLNKAGRTILLSLRGTVPSDKDDLMADASIAINRLYYSNRFKKDKEQLQKIFKQYPPNQYEYYLTGHSLGGAITNSIVREFPKNIKSAVTYNPAFQPYDIISQQRDKIKRLYTADDALYKIGGRFMNPVVVPTTKSTLPNLNFLTTGINAYQGHALDNFTSYYGLGMPKKRGRPPKKVGGSCGCMMCNK